MKRGSASDAPAGGSVLLNTLSEGNPLFRQFKHANFSKSVLSRSRAYIFGIGLTNHFYIERIRHFHTRSF